MYLFNVNNLVMLSSLISDAKFFKECRLIDYSLLVFKVDWGKYF